MITEDDAEFIDAYYYSEYPTLSEVKQKNESDFKLIIMHSRKMELYKSYE